MGLWAQQGMWPSAPSSRGAQVPRCKQGGYSHSGTRSWQYLKDGMKLRPRQERPLPWTPHPRGAVPQKGKKFMSQGDMPTQSPCSSSKCRNPEFPAHKTKSPIPLSARAFPLSLQLMCTPQAKGWPRADFAWFVDEPWTNGLGQSHALPTVGAGGGAGDPSPHTATFQYQTPGGQEF